MSAADSRPVAAHTVAGRGIVAYGMSFLWAMMVVLCAALVAAPGATVGLRAGFAAAGLVFAILVVRNLGLGVDVGPQGVTVRNVMRTRQLTWSEIARFDIVPWRGYQMFPRPVAVLNGGGQLTLSALNPPLNDLQRTVDWVAQLNAELARSRGAR